MDIISLNPTHGRRAIFANPKPGCPGQDSVEDSRSLGPHMAMNGVS